MKKKIFTIVMAVILSASMSTQTFAVAFSNLGVEQREIITKQKLNEKLKDTQDAPVTLKNGSYFLGKRVHSSLFITDNISGNFTIKNCVLEKDLVIYSSSLKTLDIENTSINGNIYILKTGNANSINLKSSKVKDIIVNSPTSIRQYGISFIENIIVSKDYDATKWLTVKADIKKFVNYKKDLYLNYTGTIDNAVVNQPFNINGRYKMKVKTQDQNLYPDTFIFNLKDITSKKGYENLNDRTSYQDLYNYLKLVQRPELETISIFVENTEPDKIKEFNDVMINTFSVFIPNNISAVYTTNYNIDEKGKLGVLNINYIFDTDLKSIYMAEKQAENMYNQIKNYNGKDYVRAVNKILAQTIRYDETLKKHNIYDAAIDKVAVCEGYAKLGYELLAKKFGKENNIIITNDDHMWNMLKLDGKWYHLDFTYNDPVTKPYDPLNYTEEFLFLNDQQMSKIGQRTWDKNKFPKAV